MYYVYTDSGAAQTTHTSTGGLYCVAACLLDSRRRRLPTTAPVPGRAQTRFIFSFFMFSTSTAQPPPPPSLPPLPAPPLPPLPPPPCPYTPPPPTHSSVKRLAEEFTATGSPLHVLVNNAGGMAPGPFAVTADGFETWVPVAGGGKGGRRGGGVAVAGWRWRWRSGGGVAGHVGDG